jgi:glutathione-dependent peroxiredoxin
MSKRPRGQEAQIRTLLPDENAEFTRSKSMLVDKRILGLRLRSWRYLMLVAMVLSNKCSSSMTRMAI